MSAPIVTFDAGQTIIELDLGFLAERLGERGIAADPVALTAALPAAWEVYDRGVVAGVGHPWRALMSALITGAGTPCDAATVDWLFAQQRVHNLWRQPIAPMVELARELVAHGVRVGVLSNSEGRLAELLESIGVADPFAVIVDSGGLGIDKPDPRIFAHLLETIGGGGPPAVPPIHIGDSWAADVVGALGVGWRAIWYGPRVGSADDPRVAVARDPAEARAALVRWGVLPA